MTKPFIILFFVVVSVCCQSNGQSKSADTSYLKFCIETLAADSMEGRKPGTTCDLKAANFIAGQLKSFKIKPLLTNSYFQEFNYYYDSLWYHTRNVIAIINNKSADNIIIGAHYDHLGFGGKRSRSYGKHEIHNGADDNASGVALMISIAHQLKKQNSKKYNYIFVAFSGHEDGLFGSSYFTESNIVDSNSVKLMINLDMIGRADKLNPAVFMASNDSVWMAKAHSSVKQLEIKSKDLPAGDHIAFAGKHIPVLCYTTGIHDDYHKVTDDAQYINYSGMNLFREYLLYLLKNLNL